MVGEIALALLFARICLHFRVVSFEVSPAALPSPVACCAAESRIRHRLLRMNVVDTPIPTLLARARREKIRDMSGARFFSANAIVSRILRARLTRITINADTE